MSPELQAAIFARLRGVEALTGRFADAQAVTSPLKWRYGTLTKKGEPPCGNVWTDAGIDAMPAAPDVGVIRQEIVRIELWTEAQAGTFFVQKAEALELLFDERRGAPLIELVGDGKLFSSSLFQSMQAPYHDDSIDAYWGQIAFQFVEARY